MRLVSLPLPCAAGALVSVSLHCKQSRQWSTPLVMTSYYGDGSVVNE